MNNWDKLDKLPYSTTFNGSIDSWARYVGIPKNNVNLRYVTSSDGLIWSYIPIPEFDYILKEKQFKLLKFI